MNYYASPSAVIDLQEADRATFIRRTYAHLAVALLLFTGLETALLNTPAVVKLASAMTAGRWSWLIVLGIYMAVCHLAQRWAATAVKRSTQYFGLGLFVVAEVIIFCPLLLIATRIDSAILPKAALITVGLFLGLTWIAFATRKDFSFMRGFLKVGVFVAIGTIVASIIFGFDLGIIFSSLMVLLMAGSVLYQTSNVIHHYNTNQDVAASLVLFASFATMLFYVIRILIELAANRD